MRMDLKKRQCRCGAALVSYAVLVTSPTSGFQTPLRAGAHAYIGVRGGRGLFGPQRTGAAGMGRQRIRVREGGGSMHRVQRNKSLISALRATGESTQTEEKQPVDGLASSRSLEAVHRQTNEVSGKEWTVELCSKRLSMLHRKLRQVKELLAKQARDPGALDDAQLVKIARKPVLQAEIAELESLRRDLRKAQESVERPNAAPPARKKAGRLPPGPFAGGVLADRDSAAPAVGAREDVRGVNAGASTGAALRPRSSEEERYTPDGLRLASPRRRRREPAREGRATAQESRSALRGPGVSPEETAGGVFLSSLNGLSAADDSGEGTEGERRGAINLEGAGDDEYGLDQVASIEAAQEGPTGGYPKRLAVLMSFCRVSDKDTCEVLVAMGRVTVNGVVAQEPGMKVDILTDNIVANGIAVTLPPKIDNSDETRRPRTDEGKRTGPIPKAEKNTWKAKTKYRWNMDDGLLASRTRKAANAKAFAKKRGGMDS